MRFSFSGLLFIILLLAIGAFVTAPWWTFRSMRDAARTGDVQALSGMVDYNEVRQSLGSQLNGQPLSEAPPPSVWQDPIGALKHALTPPPETPPEVERYVTPRGLAALSDGRPPTAPLPPGTHEPFPRIAYWGPDRARIVVNDPQSRARRTEFTFQRRGIYDWKLVRIVLPAKQKPQPAQAPAN